MKCFSECHPYDINAVLQDIFITVKNEKMAYFASRLRNHCTFISSIIPFNFSNKSTQIHKKS